MTFGFLAARLLLERWQGARDPRPCALRVWPDALDAEREWVQRSVRNVIEYRSAATGGMWCSYAVRAACVIRYADLGASTISCVADRRAAIGSVGERYGRNFMRQVDNSEMPATTSYCGASRCHPMGVPGRYSLMRAMANASASTPAHKAILARQGSRNAGSGPATVRSYDSPKNATRRRATTPRISKSENATLATAASSACSSASLMKFSR